MQVFAKYVIEETITDREKIMELRQAAAKQLQEVMQSGKAPLAASSPTLGGPSLFWRSIRRMSSSTCLHRYSTPYASKPIRS